MRIKSNIGLWLLPLLPFMFISLIFSSGCQEPTNDSQSYIPLTGVWEGTLDIGASVVLDLVEVRSDSIIGDIVVGTSTHVETYSIGYGIRVENDSLLISASTKFTHLAFFDMTGFADDSVMTAVCIMYPPDPHVETTLLAKRVQ